MNVIFQIIGFVLPVLTVCLIAYFAWWWSRKQRSHIPKNDELHTSLDSGVESTLVPSDELPMQGDDVEAESTEEAYAPEPDTVSNEGDLDSNPVEDHIEPDDVDLSAVQTAEDSIEEDGRRVEIVSDVDIDAIVSQLSNDESVLAAAVGMADSTADAGPESEVAADKALEMRDPELEPKIAAESPTQSTSIPPASIPPRKSSVGEATARPSGHDAVDLNAETGQWHSRPIPPRRRPQPESPVTSLADVDDDDSGEIRVVAAHEVPDAHVAKAEYADSQDELEQLRLALEASHHELSHLTVARDQALSRASQQESQLASFQQQIGEIAGSQADLQSERETLAGLVGELRANTESLQAELEDTREKLANAEQQLTDNSTEEAIQQIEAQHQATVDELRSVLGQREAAEASMARERDAIHERNAELQRKIDALHADLALVSTETVAPEVNKSDSVKSTDSLIEEANAESAARIDELEAVQLQQSAELSLANETVRQLNQNLSQRDAQLMNLRRDHDALANEIAQLREAAEVAESEGDTALIELGKERDRVLVQLESMKDELDSAKADVTQSKERVNGLQGELSEKKRLISTIEESAASKVDAAELDELKTQLEQALNANTMLMAEKESIETEFATEKTHFIQQIEELQAAPVVEESVVDELMSTDETNAVNANAADSESAVDSGRISELETSLEQHEEYARVLLADKQDLLDRLGAAQEEIDAKAAEMRRMQDRLGVAEDSATVSEQQAETIQKLETRVTDLSEELETRNSDLKRIQDEQIDLKQELACLTDASEEWSAERISLFTRLGLDANGEPTEESPESANDESSDGAQTIPEETLAELARLRAALEDRGLAFTELQKRFEELQRMYESSGEASTLRDDEADSLRADRDQAATAAAEASATIASLMSEVQSLKNNSAASDAKVAKLAEENQEFRRSVSELHAVANELEEQKTDRIREQETARQRLQEATTANSELTAEIAALREELSREDSVEDVADLASNAQQELTEARNTLRELQTERDKRNKEIAELRSQLEAVPQDRKEAGKIARDAKRLQAAFAKNETRLQDRDDRLQELAAELSRTRGEAASLKSQLNEQLAVLRAVNRGGAHSSLTTSEQNGLVKKAARPKAAAQKKVSRGKSGKQPATVKKKVSRVVRGKKPTKPAKHAVHGKSLKSTIKDPNLGRVYTHRPSEIDDLKIISGIGPVLEKRLNSVGIYHFEQVKDWSKSTIAFLDEDLSLGGRIARERWVEQAKKLARKSR